MLFSKAEAELSPRPLGRRRRWLEVGFSDKLAINLKIPIFVEDRHRCLQVQTWLGPHVTLRVVALKVVAHTKYYTVLCSTIYFAEKLGNLTEAAGV